MAARSPIARNDLFPLKLAAAIAGALFAAPAPAASDPIPLKVCADPDNPPFTAKDSDKPGFYLEVAEHVARALGRPMQPVWAATYSPKRMLRTTLFAGQCDMFGGVPSQDAGGRPIPLTRAIVDVSYAIVVPANRRATAIDDLKGLRVAVEFGSPVQAMLADRTDLRPVTVASPEQGMQALRSGRVDAGVLWGPSAGYLNVAAADQSYKIIPLSGNGLSFSAAIGFAPGKEALRDQVDAILMRDADFVKQTAARYGFPGTELAAASGFGEDLVIPNVTAGSPLPPGEHAAPKTPAGEGKDSAGAASASVGFGEDLAIPAVTTGTPLPPGSRKAPQYPAGEGQNSSRVSATAAAMSSELADPAKVRAGADLFNATCVHCHGPDAVTTERRINLRLLHHKYGDRMDEVMLYTVTHGRPDKGMPNWTGVFTDEQFKEMLAFLHTVQEQ